MTNPSDIPVEDSGADRREGGLSRRNFIAASASLAGSIVAGRAAARVTCRRADRARLAPTSADTASDRNTSRSPGIPEAGPGQRNVDPSDAINSKAPLDKLFGSITPSDLHYERSHSGAPDIDPAKHRLLVHGMVRKPLVFSVEDLKAMPSISRVVFIECTGNGWGELEERRPESHSPEHARSRQYQRMDRCPAQNS